MMKIYLRPLRLIMLVAVLQILFLGIAQETRAAEQKATSFQQSIVYIIGKVTDSAGKPLTGATVTQRDSSNGAIVDSDGHFVLNLPAGSKMDVSFLGYDSVTIAVTEAMSGKELNITLTESDISIGEVVVVGYGVQKKATLSGSVAVLGGNELVKSPAMNVTNSLAGVLPGLVVVGQSGEPGSDYASLYIRGQNSLHNNQPLVVIDGVPNRSLERIDPATIQSISVLKDASAAIYGSQAANGVILVTTKRGTAGKLVVDANYRMGWSRPTRVPQLTNSAEFATLANEWAYYEDSNNGHFSVYSAEDIQKYADGSDPWKYPSTDWFKEVLKPWSQQHNANVTFSGGSDKVKSFTSVSSRFQDSFFYGNSSGYAQHDLRSNLDGKINDYITVNLDAALRLEDCRFLASGSSELFRSLMLTTPMVPARWPNGKPSTLTTGKDTNPLMQSSKDAGYNNRQNLIANVNAKIDIKIPWVEGLSVTGTAAIDRGYYYGKQFSKQYTLYYWDKVTMENGSPKLTEVVAGGSPSLTQSLDLSRRYMVNGLVNYQRTFGLGDLNVMAGIEAIEESTNWFNAMRKGFIGNKPDELRFGDPEQQFADGSSPEMLRWQNYFGRVNYSYDNKYIVEFVWRYQGSSKFLHRWGFFPGISVAYRPTNYIKLRASWGKTGNDLIDPGQFRSSYELGWLYMNADSKYTPTMKEAMAANANVSWEKAVQYNVGIDILSFGGKLTFSADYFNNLRTDILVPQSASTPDFTGLSGILPAVNIGKVRNQGFDFSLTYNDQSGDFRYGFVLNGGYAKNKVLFFDEAEGVLEWQKRTGYPIAPGGLDPNSGKFYDADGIFHTQADIDKWNNYAKEKTGNVDAEYIGGARPGDVFYRDVNGDGIINGEDMIRIRKTIVPTWTGGLNINLGYKSFDLSLMFNGQAGAVRYVLPLGSSSAGINYWKSFYDKRWTEDNTSASYPRTFDRNSPYWMSSDSPSTFWLRKTDFMRLKNIELGYTLPENVVKKLGLSNVRISLSGMNLLTYAPDMPDFDPELQYYGEGFAGTGYPIQKMITAGIAVKF